MSDRVEIDLSTLSVAESYPLLNACVVPRPIAWVVTRSADGVDNLAPHSYFTISGVDPAVVQITAVGKHDTLRNLRETREAVICVSPQPLADVINLTATDFPPEVSEIDIAGLTRQPSLTVAPPRIAESPVVLECRYLEEKSFGICTVVFVEVLHIALDADVVDADNHPDIHRFQPASRLGKNLWGGFGQTWDLPRVPFTDWQEQELSERKPGAGG